MSNGRHTKSKVAPFGKRGSETVLLVRKPSVLQRLTKAGGRWWAKMVPGGKTQKRATGAGRQRSRT